MRSLLKVGLVAVLAFAAAGCDHENAPHHDDDDFDLDEWVDEEFPSQPDDLVRDAGSTVQLPVDAGPAMPPNVADNSTLRRPSAVTWLTCSALKGRVRGRRQA